MDFVRSRVARLLLLPVLWLSSLPGCDLQTDADQVQVVTVAAEFKAFASLPRAIAYGPYSLKVTRDSAIIAWEERAWNNQLRHVEVEVADLKPTTEYFYRVNGAEQDGRFLTAPNTAGNFSFFVWGDSRTGHEVAKQIAGQMMARDPQAAFALHAGDLVLDGDDPEAWEQDWWQPMSDLMLQLPIYPTMGNHELNSEYYYRYFASLGGQGTNYSFDWGSVHIVVLDSNRENFGSQEQIAWLTSDLAEHSDADFTIVCHHHPVYDASPAANNGMQYLQEVLVPLYEEYGVDLVVNGHVHNYQHHVKNNTHYLVSAAGGEMPYGFGAPFEGMTLALWQSYNFVHFQVKDRTLLATAHDHNGEILESFEILADAQPEITAQIAVEASQADVVRGEPFRLDIYVAGATGLSDMAFELSVVKQEPDVRLEVGDADPVREGIQIQPGDMQGIVTVNEADPDRGVVQYEEKNIAVRSDGQTKVAAIDFEVPADAPVTAMFLVPRCTLRDTAGKELPHFMGGVKIAIRAQ